MNPNFKHENGREATQITTGLKGVITARADNLHGCNRYYLQPKAGKDSKVPSGWWVDENDLKTGKMKAGLKLNPKDPPGGPMSKVK